jgi:hypothetical protein
MIVLDENVVDSQRQVLRRKHLRVHQIGYELGRKGMSDPDIIRLLHTLRHPTMFTNDLRLYRQGLCHERYCLVVLDVERKHVAEYVLKILRHPQLSTHRQRMGHVLLGTPQGVHFWTMHQKKQGLLRWNARTRRN